MSMNEARKYIEKELKRGSSKNEIEKYLKAHYREGLYKNLLATYPEPTLFNKFKKLNWILVGFVLIILIIHIVSFFLIGYLSPKTLISFSIITPFTFLLLDFVMLVSILKGLAYGYVLALIYALMTILIGTWLEIILVIPMAIISYFLKTKIHPNYGWFGLKKSKTV